MSTLRIRVDKYLESEGGPPPQVFARIQRMDERGRSVAQTLQHELVPISSDPTQAQAIVLQPGNYNVEVRLPSGELLSDAVRLGDGAQEMVLVAAPSSREWLGWQHLVGNVASGAELVSKSAHRGAPRDESLAKPRKRDPRSRGMAGAAPGAPAPRPPSLTERLSSVMQRVGLSISNGVIGPSSTEPESPWEPQRAATIEVDRPLHWLGSGESKLGVDLLRGDPWHALPELRGSTAHIVDALNAGRPQLLIEPSAHDDESAVFRVPNAPAGQGAYAPANRNFVAVQRRTGVELVCLPTPWVDPWTGRDVAVEIGVQRPKYEVEFASAIAVRDQQLAVLLGFLSSGALPAAKRLAETAGTMLYEKNENPLAAAAGGYALVSSAVDAQHQPWHDWIKNLMERFEHVPDGAIQYGTMRLRIRTSTADFKEATEAFKLAYRRGLPFYGLGMRWLLEGLERVGSEDEEAKAMAKSVRRLAARLHPQSPFTILRLGRR